MKKGNIFGGNNALLPSAKMVFSAFFIKTMKVEKEVTNLEFFLNEIADLLSHEGVHYSVFEHLTNCDKEEIIEWLNKPHNQ